MKGKGILLGTVDLVVCIVLFFTAGAAYEQRYLELLRRDFTWDSSLLDTLAVALVRSLIVVGVSVLAGKRAAADGPLMDDRSPGWALQLGLLATSVISICYAIAKLVYMEMAGPSEMKHAPSYSIAVAAVACTLAFSFLQGILVPYIPRYIRCARVRRRRVRRRKEMAEEQTTHSLHSLCLLYVLMKQDGALEETCSRRNRAPHR